MYTQLCRKGFDSIASTRSRRRRRKIVFGRRQLRIYAGTRSPTRAGKRGAQGDEGDDKREDDSPARGDRPRPLVCSG